jgi:hypothetical protein
VAEFTIGASCRVDPTLNLLPLFVQEGTIQNPSGPQPPHIHDLARDVLDLTGASWSFLVLRKILFRKAAGKGLGLRGRDYCLLAHPYQ